MEFIDIAVDIDTREELVIQNTHNW